MYSFNLSTTVLSKCPASSLVSTLSILATPSEPIIFAKSNALNASPTEIEQTTPVIPPRCEVDSLKINMFDMVLSDSVVVAMELDDSPPLPDIEIDDSGKWRYFPL